MEESEEEAGEQHFSTRTATLSDRGEVAVSLSPLPNPQFRI